MCVCTQLCPTLLQPHGLETAGLLCPWDFSGKNTRMTAISSSRDLPNPATEPTLMCPALWADSLPAEPSGKSRKTAARGSHCSAQNSATPAAALRRKVKVLTMVLSA